MVLLKNRFSPVNQDRFQRKARAAEMALWIEQEKPCFEDENGQAAACLKIVFTVFLKDRATRTR